MFEINDEMVEKVKSAAGVQMARVQNTLSREPDVGLTTGAPRAGLVDIVVLGISTGGPQALKYLIPQLPDDFPVPIVMVMHMPVGYTEMYAQKLNEISRLKVSEAREGDEVKGGAVLLAPAGRHLTLIRQANGAVVTHLDARPFDSAHRPSVDVLFQSAAALFGSRTLGVVMTGMGSDGKQGAAWIKSQGGLVFTEAEQSCIVYGMPLSVVEAGLSDKSVPLERMAQTILEVV
jgi:two-component system chemotaxis response regulator CheB